MIIIQVDQHKCCSYQYAAMITWITSSHMIEIFDLITLQLGHGRIEAEYVLQSQ